MLTLLIYFPIVWFVVGVSSDLNGINVSMIGHANSNYSKYYTASSMPVLEDGLSSGHDSDIENNNNNNNTGHNVHQSYNNGTVDGYLTQSQPHNSIVQHPSATSGISLLMDLQRVAPATNSSSLNSVNNVTTSTTDVSSGKDTNNSLIVERKAALQHHSPQKSLIFGRRNASEGTTHATALGTLANGLLNESNILEVKAKCQPLTTSGGAGGHISNTSNANIPNSSNKVFRNIDPDLDSLYSISKSYSLPINDRCN